MDARQLGYFISVAEHLSFTKAAQQHYIAQTSISQQILVLEKQLGVKLFERNNRSVQLTSAGKVFYKEAKQILAKSEAAIEKARRAADGFEGTLKVGFQGSYFRKMLPTLFKNFRHIYPSIDLTITHQNVEQLNDALNHGHIDIQFHAYNRTNDNPDIDCQTIYKAPLCAVVYHSHPLANEVMIKLSDLASESFVHNYPNGSGFYEHFISACARHGFTPNIVAQACHHEAQLIMVEAEIGVAVLPKPYSEYSNGNLRFINLDGEDMFVEAGISWQKKNDNPAIPLLVKLAVEHSLQSK